MGLDMYLRANVPAPKDSPFHKVIEEHLTDKQRKELESDSYAYVSGWSFGNEQPDALFKALSLEMGIEPTSESPSMHLRREADGYVIEPTIYYWRKANAIHKWFVDQTQDGEDRNGESVVHPELLADLMERVERIHLAPQSEKEALAAELLPTQGGFFFGPTEYGEWYFSDIEQTAKGLKAAVEVAAPKATHFIYDASW